MSNQQPQIIIKNVVHNDPTHGCCGCLVALFILYFIFMMIGLAS
jgi:hypothetical protein